MPESLAVLDKNLFVEMTRTVREFSRLSRKDCSVRTSRKLPIAVRCENTLAKWANYKYNSSTVKLEYDRPMKVEERAELGLFDDKKSSDDLIGEPLLNKIIKTMEMFGKGTERVEMRDDQRIMFSHCLCALLPLIYGKKLEANRDKLLKKLGLTKIREQLIILASRRVGKTTFFAMLLASLMICVPKVEIACFSLALRASRKVMRLVTDLIEIYTGDDVITFKTKNQDKMIIIGDENWKCKIFHSFPDTTHVCSFLFVSFFSFSISLLGRHFITHVHTRTCTDKVSIVITLSLLFR